MRIIYYPITLNFHSTKAHQMNIIFANQKGGTGKSTLAICVAHSMSKQNIEIQLIDTDPQQSSSRWLDRSKGSVKGKYEPVENLEAILKEAPDAIKIIDTVGKFGATEQNAWRTILAQSALVIVPVLPTPIDLESALDLLEAIRHTKRRAQVVTIINKAKHGRMTDQAEAALCALPFPHLKTRIYDRIDYARSLGFGTSPAGLAKSNKARCEIENLTTEIKNYV